MTDTIAAAMLAASSLTIITVFGGAWVLSGRMSSVEAKIAAMDAGMNDKLTSAVLTHQLKCPAAREGRAVRPADEVDL